MDGKASMSASSHSGRPDYRRGRIAITAKKLITAAGTSRGFLNKNKLMELSHARRACPRPLQIVQKSRSKNRRASFLRQ